MKFDKVQQFLSPHVEANNIHPLQLGPDMVGLDEPRQGDGCRKGQEELQIGEVAHPDQGLTESAMFMLTMLIMALFTPR